jgi:hypothetical protein
VFRGDLPGGVPGVGVGHDNLKIFYGLAIQGLQQTRQVFLFIEGGDNDAEHGEVRSLEIYLFVL